MDKITEIIPNDIPEWASKAMQEGRFYRTAVELVESKGFTVTSMEERSFKVPKGQSKKASLIETIFGLSVGFLIAWVSWIFPIPQLFGIEASRGVAVGITLYFTVLSFLRGYGVRRLFNYLHNRGNKNV